MSKTYRSMFLTCGSCKLQVDSDSKFCKHCGRTVWLKDVSEASISAPVEVPKSVAENIEKLEEEKRQQQLESLSRAKIQQELAKWLPTIFPDQYYVAPNPMPKEILEFLIENMGKERTYDMNILGYGYDSGNNSFFVFDNEAMYYKFLTSERIRHQVKYSSIKELAVGNRQLTIKMGMVGIKSFPIFCDRALAEMLSAITGVRVKLDESNSTAKVAVGEIRMATNGGQSATSNSSETSKPAETTNQSENNQSTKTPVQKTEYTVNDYIRGNTTCVMWLVMFGARFCLGLQCMSTFFDNYDSIVFSILFGFFALGIGYCRPVFTSLALGYCLYIAGNQDFIFGAGLHKIAVGFLIVALIFRYIVGEKYKEYMAQGKKQ